MKIALRCITSALIVTVVAFGIPRQAPSAEPYTIPVILPLTGNGAFAGQTHATAVKVYETVANASGGIHGRPVHFEIHDDQSSPVIDVQLVNQLLAKNPPVILGSSSIAGCAAEAPLLHDTVEFCLSPGLITKQSNVFASSIAITYITSSTLKFYIARGYTRVGVISTTDATGQAADALTLAALARPENSSLKLVDYEHFNPSDISVAAQVARLKAADPQGLIVFATGNAFGTVLRALHDAGVDVPLHTSAVNMNVRQLGDYNGFLPKELFFNAEMYEAPEEVKVSSLKAAIDEFYAAYKKAGIEPSPESGLSWDPAKIVVAALRALPPNATGQQLASYINNLHDFAGVCGLYDFRTGDHHGLTESSLMFVKWVPATKSFSAVSKLGGEPLPPSN